MSDPTSKTVRIKDLGVLRKAQGALRQLLRADVSEATVIEAGLHSLIEKLSGMSLPADRVRPLILKCQVAAMQRLIRDLAALGYPVEDVLISLDERRGGIAIEHGETKIHYEAGDPAGMTMIN